MASKRANSKKLSGPISGVIFPASPFPNPSPLSRSFNDVARLSPASLAAAPLFVITEIIRKYLEYYFIVLLSDEFFDEKKYFSNDIKNTIFIGYT